MSHGYTQEHCVHTGPGPHVGVPLADVPLLSCLFSAACECTPGWALLFPCCFEPGETQEAPHRPSGWRGPPVDLHHPTAAQWEEVSEAPSARAEKTRGDLTCLLVVLFKFADVFAEELV